MILNTEIGSNSKTRWGHVPYPLIRHVSQTHNSDHQNTGPVSIVMYAGLTVTIKLHCPAAGKEKFGPSPVEIQSHAAPRRVLRRTPRQDHTNPEVDVDSESKNRNKTDKYWVPDIDVEIDVDSESKHKNKRAECTLQSRQTGPVEVLTPTHSILASPANQHSFPSDFGSVSSIITPVHSSVTFTRLPRL